MRQLKCEISGSTQSLMGKVTLQGVSRRDRPDYVLVARPDGKVDIGGYKAVITGDGFRPRLAFLNRTPIARVDLDLTVFHDGDVLSIEPEEGLVTFLYESESRDNALFVTERCNCRCITCPQPPKSTEDSRTTFNRELIRLMAPGPETLAITGGEPTILGDELLTLIEDCRDRLPETNVIILSNGRRFKDQPFVERIARLGHPRLTIAVALYGDLDHLHDEIVGVRGAFNETVRGIHCLALYGFLVEIRVVISSLNFRRLPKIVDFIYANMPFACHVALMGLEPVGLAERNLERIWIDPFDYRRELEQACRYLHRRIIPVSVYNLPLCVIPESLWPVARQSISGWKNVYPPECEACRVKRDCCGLFASSDIRRSAHLASLDFKQVDDMSVGVR